MSMTITLPDNLAQTIQIKAENRQLPLDALVADILADAGEPRFVEWPTVEEIVVRIKTINPDPNNFHPATDSLAELFADAPADPTFDLDEWNREWAEAEAEIKAITRANTLAEGHG